MPFFFSFFSTLAFYLYVEYLKCNVMLYIIILLYYVHPLYLHKYQRLKYIFIKFQLHFDSPKSFMFSFITKPEMTRKLFQIQDIIKENRKLFVFQLIVPYFFFQGTLELSYCSKCYFMIYCLHYFHVFIICQIERLLKTNKGSNQNNFLRPFITNSPYFTTHTL